MKIQHPIPISYTIFPTHHESNTFGRSGQKKTSARPKIEHIDSLIPRTTRTKQNRCELVKISIITIPVINYLHETNTLLGRWSFDGTN